jgi:TrmH family RNA methyltransferase
MISKARLKELGKLKNKKERARQKRFLIEGLRLCEEAAGSSWSVETVLFTRSFGEKAREKALIRKLQSLKTELVQVGAKELDRFSDTVTSQGIICVVEAKKHPLEDIWKKERPRGSKNELVLALDGISDPGNVGTLIRTADAFGVTAVLLSAHTVELYNPKVIRSTMGSIFHLSVFDEVDLENVIPQLKKRGFRILGTDVHQGTKLENLQPPRKTCLLMGSEAEGLSSRLLKVSDETVRIPARGKAESLNVAVAAGILLYKMTNKLTSD